MAWSRARFVSPWWWGRSASRTRVRSLSGLSSPSATAEDRLDEASEHGVGLQLVDDCLARSRWYARATPRTPSGAREALAHDHPLVPRRRGGLRRPRRETKCL